MADFTPMNNPIPPALLPPGQAADKPDGEPFSGDALFFVAANRRSTATAVGAGQ